jgi:DNA-binding transcriptional regulator GbsR (MarR family)
MKPAAKSPQELAALAEQIGHFIRHWGFKSVHGRLWTYLYLSSEPMDAAALIRKLRVSKALMSISLKELLKYGVVESSGRSSEGTQLYQANEDVMAAILNVLRLREKNLITRILAEFENINRLSTADLKQGKVSASRKEALGELIQLANATLDSFLTLSHTDFTPWRAFTTQEK